MGSRPGNPATVCTSCPRMPDTTHERLDVARSEPARRPTVPSGPVMVPSHRNRLDSVSGNADYSCDQSRLTHMLGAQPHVRYQGLESSRPPDQPPTPHTRSDHTHHQCHELLAQSRSSQSKQISWKAEPKPEPVDRPLGHSETGAFALRCRAALCVRRRCAGRPWYGSRHASSPLQCLDDWDNSRRCLLM